MKTYDKVFYDGKWQETDSTSYAEVLNPATEEVIAKVVQGTHDDVDKAVASAKAAFPEWNATAPEKRAEYIEKIRQGIEDRKQELAETMIAELGASRTFIEKGQLPLSLREIDATLDGIKDYKFEEEVDNATIVKEGYGVVAAITPWNYPLNQIQRKLTPALLAGNTIVVNPATNTPLTAILYAEIIEAAGLPKGVFNLITGKGSDTGAYLAKQPDVDVISFTGSTKVGRGLYESAATNVKKLVLELGGKSPMVYLKGGDLELAVKSAADTLLDNQGQTCSAWSRLLVPRDELEHTKEIIKDYYKTIKVGDPTENDTKVGPMVSEKQMNRVLNYIQIGIDEGATLLLGGHRVDRKGYYIEPTVFTDVTNDMRIAQEEIFGPVLVVITYDTEEEALEIANDSTYGLSGAVVGPQDKALAFAHKMRTGNITVNGGARTPKAPFGGYNQSGIGRENGLFGLEDYLEVKALFK